MFGSPAHADGRPRAPLHRRLERAASLAGELGDVRFVLTGGSVWGPVEADAMLRYLVAGGVPEDRCLLDRAARNTLENALNSGRLLVEAAAARAWLVTDELHMARSHRLLQAVLSRLGSRVELQRAPARQRLESRLGALGYRVAERLKLARDLRDRRLRDLAATAAARRDR